MDDSEEQVYELERRTLAVKFKAKDGTVQTYTLKEMDGAEREQFLGEFAKLVKPDGDGKPTRPENAGKMFAELLSRTLYDPAGELVTKVLCNKLPASVQDDLFRKSQKLNGLGKTAEADAKND